MLTFKTQGSRGAGRSCLCVDTVDEYIKSYRSGLEISAGHNVVLCQRAALRLPAVDLMLHGGFDVRERGGKKRVAGFQVQQR